MNSIAFEKSEVKEGTVNRLLLDIDTDEPVDHYLLALSGFHVYVAAYYNAETGLYEALVHTNGLFRDEIILHELYASVEERCQSIDLQDTEYNEVNFSIIPTEEDENEERVIFGTTVEREAIKQPDSFVKAGDTVTVKVPVADFSKISSGSVMYHTPLSNNLIQVDLVYNEDKLVFEALIPTDETSENGWWQARQILLVDTDYNNYYIGTGDDKGAQLMSGLDFILSGGANSGYVEPLTVTSIETNADSFEPGEDVQIAVGITDPRFESLELTYRLPESRATRLVKADFNDETGVYEANLTLNNHAEAGIWLLEQVQASDSNIVDGVSVLLDGNFSVINENSKVSLPKVITEEYSASFDPETGRLQVRTSVTEPEMVSSVSVNYYDRSTGQRVYVLLTQTGDDGIFEGTFSLQQDTNLDNLKLMTIDLYGHGVTLFDSVKTTHLNPVTGIDAVFSDIAVASDEEDESDDTDVSPELPEDDTDENDSDEDTDDESDEDNEDETDSEEEAGSDVPTDETDETNSHSDVEDNDEDETEHDFEEIVEENDNHESGDEVEEETDELDSEETADSETTEVEEAVETDAEEDTEDVDSSTVLPDTATATWTIGLASFASLLSGLGIRFASKKKRKQ